MKIKSQLSTFILAGVMLVSLTNCGTKKMEEQPASYEETAVVEEASAVAAPQFVVDEQFQKQLGAVFASYVSLKEAFVATDAVKVKVEA